MKELYFIMGTEAELMKCFPVINRAKAAGYTCKIIATGQNVIFESPYLELIDEKVFMDICGYLPERRRTGGYLKWLLRTLRKGKRMLREHFAGRDKGEYLLVVHGDTLTTALGARLAKRLHLPYVHIESGLRSYHMLSPFPEEFDRLYGSSGAKINFCPGQGYAQYAAKKFKGKSVNTVYNTGIETLHHALEQTRRREAPLRQPPYFMCMIHRQENLLSKSFMTQTIENVVKLSEKMPCVFIYFKQSKDVMDQYGIAGLIENAPNVEVLQRQNYLDFVDLVDHSAFIVGDGCGNQQEFYYLGKPYLIMRTQVEQDSEGLGHNAKVFGGDFANILKFIDAYKEYTKPEIVPEAMPSQIILEAIDEYFAGAAQ